MVRCHVEWALRLDLTERDRGRRAEMMARFVGAGISGNVILRARLIPLAPFESLANKTKTPPRDGVSYCRFCVSAYAGILDSSSLGSRST